MAQRNTKRSPRKPKATTGDVLGTTAASAAPVRVPRKWEQHYRRLLQLRDQVLRRQADLAQDALEEQPTFSTHLADAGTDTFDRDMALSVLSSEQDSLYQIDQALDRIRQGKYGICELTGRPIEPERLQAIPWTRFSAAAEKQLERQGARPRVTLAKRDTVPKETVSNSEDDSG